MAITRKFLTSCSANLKTFSKCKGSYAYQLARKVDQEIKSWKKSHYEKDINGIDWTNKEFDLKQYHVMTNPFDVPF